MPGKLASTFFGTQAGQQLALEMPTVSSTSNALNTILQIAWLLLFLNPVIHGAWAWAHVPGAAAQGRKIHISEFIQQVWSRSFKDSQSQ